MPETLEQRRARYALNREKINAQKRALRARDPQKINDQQRAWRALNREKHLAQRRARWARDREKLRAERVRDRDKRRGQAMRQKHGMWPEDWTALWDAQDGRCYLCGGGLVDGHVVVDHDHSCCGERKSCRICRRGLTCRVCNSLIGLAGDDPDRIERMAANLRSAKRGVAERMAAFSEPVELLF
jgi:recombination endonuclease VII